MAKLAHLETPVDSLENNINCFIGRQLLTLRLTYGLSMSVVGREIGVTGQQIQKYESGKDRVSIERLFALAALFDVPVTAFFPGEMADKHVEQLSHSNIRLLKLLNKISEEHYQAVYAIIRALFSIAGTQEESGMAA